MKSLLVIAAAATVLTAGVLASGQSLDLVNAGALLFAAGLAGFVFVDYQRAARRALRCGGRVRAVAPRAKHATRPARVARGNAADALLRTVSPFNSIAG